ncbi:MAG: threonine/serine exporter [Sulfobacillus acidophilus]|uniref:Threonine/serine exporter n=1 Tax=Sulfobacillus acidophilus TaxID=53633 RepID=A0A2T2WMW8_9FIRM|nr:MAG: threonine/serine exporter [Sulfobacillus acidophilus]
MNPTSRGRAQTPDPDVLKVIADAGAALLASGGEVARVEDTMQRLARAYGVEAVEVIVLPTALFINAGGNTVIRRIRNRSVNLAVVASINQLSRDVSRNPIPLGELEERLAQARHASRYRPSANLLFAGVAAGALSQLVGGRGADVLPAVIGGALTQIVRQWFRRIGLANGVGDMGAAAVAVLPAVACAYWRVPRPGSVLVGGIMVLTPGLLMTTAVRDGIEGDLLSAAARVLEALLSAGAIAAGASLPLYLYLALGGHWA